jgi:DNA-3-methyladenine glycosylase I
MGKSLDWLRIGPDGNSRCWWCGEDEQYVEYHDFEWGRAVHDDQRLFEKVCLEGFQSGLSWITILRRREGFRAAFADFDFCEVAKFTNRDVERLLKDEGIIRHRGKIEATINNAQRCCELVDQQGSLSEFMWSFVPKGKDVAVGTTHESGIPAVTQASTDLSKALKKQGWKFVGPTTMYALMQAVGMVNDHLPGCFVQEECGRQ